jgi:hypothetical protein
MESIKEPVAVRGGKPRPAEHFNEVRKREDTGAFRG